MHFSAITDNIIRSVSCFQFPGTALMELQPRFRYLHGNPATARVGNGNSDEAYREIRTLVRVYWEALAVSRN